MKKINLKKYLKNKIMISVLIITIILLSLVLMLIKKEDSKDTDTLKYKGETYVYLEYNSDVFTYNYYYNDYLEEEKIHPVNHDKWEMVYLNGDLFVLEKEVKEAKKYYADDKNYDWMITIEENDTETIAPISLTEEEIEYIYNLDDKPRNETMLFEDIEGFADITKISKDKTVFALITLVKYKDSWYWKTEVMTDEEPSKEYIIKLPESLDKKIKEATN